MEEFRVLQADLIFCPLMLAFALLAGAWIGLKKACKCIFCRRKEEGNEREADS